MLGFDSPDDLDNASSESVVVESEEEDDDVPPEVSNEA